eukprot:CFRG8335T1
MFFHIDLEHELVVHPQYFGPKLHKTIKLLLHEEVEGTCSGKYGYIIAVTQVVNVGKGMIQEGRGLATFNVKYRAIVLRPFKGEVVDAEVTQVTKLGIFAQVGPLQIFVSRNNMSNSLVYDDTEQIFRSKEELFQALKVGQGDDVRIRIINTRRDFKETFAIGILLRIDTVYIEDF